MDRYGTERDGKCCISLFSLANSATLGENNIQIKCSVSLYKYVFALNAYKGLLGFSLVFLMMLVVCHLCADILSFVIIRHVLAVIYTGKNEIAFSFCQATFKLLKVLKRKKIVMV